jgi:hypothetical protein
LEFGIGYRILMNGNRKFGKRNRIGKGILNWKLENWNWKMEWNLERNFELEFGILNGNFE